jgi:hypothetical protein
MDRWRQDASFTCSRRVAERFRHETHRNATKQAKAVRSRCGGRDVCGTYAARWSSGVHQQYTKCRAYCPGSYSDDQDLLGWVADGAAARLLPFLPFLPFFRPCSLSSWVNGGQNGRNYGVFIAHSPPLVVIWCGRDLSRGSSARPGTVHRRGEGSGARSSARGQRLACSALGRHGRPWGKRSTGETRRPAASRRQIRAAGGRNRRRPPPTLSTRERSVTLCAAAACRSYSAHDSSQGSSQDSSQPGLETSVEMAS